MISVIKIADMWYAVYHTGDQVRSDQGNVISSYMFKSKIDAELFAEGVLKQYERQKGAGE